MRLFKIRLTVLLLALSAGGQAAWGFTLTGPAATWMTPRVGYARSPVNYGGPMGIGEEYRWQVPVVYYGFSPDFLNYFGPEGAAAIDQVFAMLNALPAASKLSPDAYPLGSVRINQKAAALFVTDLKSFTLSRVLAQVGLTDPTRFVYTLRNRWTTPATTNYYTIQRNYDPITWRPTSYINGILWTYDLVTDINDTESLVFNAPVDPVALGGLLNAPATASQGGYFFAAPGAYAVTLTRDDIGGLKYIYRPDNYNVEGLGPSLTGLQGGGGPWGAPPGTTNAIGTNTVTSNTVVNIALRGGIDKVNFRRANFDMLLGTFTPFTNTFTDVYLTNGVKVTQYLERPLGAPDILFNAADLQGGDSQDAIIGTDNAFLAWSNNDATNGIAGNLGPGVINPGDGAGPAFTVTFNSVGDIWWNIYLVPWDNLDQLTASTHVIFWGSYDGTTDEPWIYPSGVSIQEVEARVLSGEGDPWNSP